MAKRFKHQVVVFIPFAGAEMQFGDSFRGEILPQSFAKQLCKKMMIAVPAPFIVLRNDEQVGVFEIFQSPLPGHRCVE